MNNLDSFNHATEITAAERRGAVRVHREVAEELDRIDPAKDAVYWTDEGYEFVDLLAH